MIDFLLLPLLAGLIVAAMAGPLGAFVVWRRMAYFGDTLAHSALLGVALGFIFDINLSLAVIICATLLAIVLVSLDSKRLLATDTLLGIMAHSSLSLGLVALALLPDLYIDLNAYLLGDLLAINQQDLYWILLGGLVVLSLIYYLWRPLLAITINADLAQVEGVPVAKIRLVLMLLIAFTIATAMKIVGVLLITALMIIPAATARRLASTPEQMALLASVFGCSAVFFGINLSYQWDTPAGSSIVVCALVQFLLIYLMPQRAR